MTLMARYSGTCPQCGETWQPGDLIRAANGDPSTVPYGYWMHAVCPDPLATTHPVCQACWLTHPEGACDR